MLEHHIFDALWNFKSTTMKTIFLLFVTLGFAACGTVAPHATPSTAPVSQAIRDARGHIRAVRAIAATATKAGISAGSEQAKALASEADQAEFTLVQAEQETVVLQSRIDEQANLLVRTETGYRKAKESADMWHEKQKTAVSKLNFYRVPVFTVAGGAVLFGLFKILTIFGLKLL